MKPKPHGNSHENVNAHHLYAIHDDVEKDIYKYGISGDPLLEDGTSKRANKQVREYNRVVGMLRFFATILKTGISGRKKAEEVETKMILDYEQQYKRRPRGNPPKKDS